MDPSTNQKTQHLVASAQEGNASALNQLCSVYGERVRRIIRLRLDRKLRPKLDSVDVAQDALMLALEGLQDFSYKDEGDFLRWLAKIAENRFRDILDKFHAGKRDIHREMPLRQEGRRTEDGFVGAAGPLRTTTPSVIPARTGRGREAIRLKVGVRAAKATAATATAQQALRAPRAGKRSESQLPKPEETRRRPKVPEAA